MLFILFVCFFFFKPVLSVFDEEFLICFFFSLSLSPRQEAVEVKETNLPKQERKVFDD